jgi:hypothetical protein
MEFLEQFKPVTSKLELKGADGKPSGVTLELQAIDSDPVKAVLREIQSENAELGPDSYTPERQEENTRRQYSATIVSWTWAKGLTLNGKENPECNDANKLALLKVPVIFRQIDAHLAKAGNFLAGSRNTSAAA